MGAWLLYIQDNVYYFLTGLLFCAFQVQPVTTLSCYECSESFADIWIPLDCQVNATAVPSRECNDKQPFCFVASVTVKGILTQITRNCIDQCFYGCVAADFGVTTLTCTSCCDDDLCNTGNVATNVHKHCSYLWRLPFVSLFLVISSKVYLFHTQ